MNTAVTESHKALSTGQIAKLVQVAPRTVSKWIDSGLLPGYRLPGSRDRRVPRASLVKFLADNNMPSIEQLEGSGAQGD